MSADPKRVFLPMGDSSDFLKKPEKNTGATNSKSKTLRLELELFEPDEYKFPEFNYRKLVHIEKVIWTFFPSSSSSVPFIGGRRRGKEKNPFFPIYIIVCVVFWFLFCCSDLLLLHLSHFT